MPTSDQEAALQFFVEAMKANTAVLQGIQAEAKEVLKLVHDTRERVIRMESKDHAVAIAALESKHAAAVAKLETKIEAQDAKINRLQSERDRRDGAMTLTNWVLRNWPSVIGLIALILLILQTNGKLT